MRYVVGIDPGLSGAIAFYDSMMETLETFEMPTLTAGTKSKSGKNKRILDIANIAAMFDSQSSSIQKVIIENVHAMPGQGVSSMFNFGVSFGIIKGIIAANFLPVEFIEPIKWKKALRVPAAKDGARLKANEFFPKYSSQWAKAKWDGRAEAAMIAYYGARYLLDEKL
jgi:crossover junction endodeoxyribonuclease RuvC